MAAHQSGPGGRPVSLIILHFQAVDLLIALVIGLSACWTLNVIHRRDMHVRDVGITI